MKRKNYVIVEKEKLTTISTHLHDAFNIYCGKHMKLNGNKELEEYKELAKAILDTTGILLGESTLRNLITIKHNGNFQSDTFEAIDKFIATYTKTPPSFNKKTYSEPIKQKVFWSVNQGFKPGILINSFKGQFIEWDVVKKELETNVITQCPRIIPVGARVELSNFYNKKDWVIWIYDKKDNEIGSVWIGGNPLKGWYSDGLVRVGKTISDTSWEVYQVLQRYSDGSYRLVKSFV